jgi:hypothetical protein
MRCAKSALTANQNHENKIELVFDDVWKTSSRPRMAGAPQPPRSAAEPIANSTPTQKIKPMTILLASIRDRSFPRVAPRPGFFVRLGLLFVILELLVPRPTVAAGSWIPLANTAPDSVGLMILLSDGTVMAANNPSSAVGDVGNDWYCLTPDNSGLYMNGAWSRRTSMNYTRLFYSAQVLQDGRLFLAGGEYGNGRSTAEVFNPLATNWTVINPPSSLLNPNFNSPNTGTNEGLVDAEAKLLNDGNVLLAPIAPSTLNGTLIYNPNANTWSAGPQSQNWQAEVSWVKLPDGSILTVDPLDGSAQSRGTNSERYIPSLTPPRWVPDANLPVNLWANLLPVAVGETGPAFLLPNGKAFFLGGSGHTAIYTPSPLGGTNFGSWVAGPDIPGGLVSADAPAAMMPNGKILCSVSASPYIDGQNNLQFSRPASFFEYDYADHTQGPNGSFTQVNGPTGLTDNINTYQSAMLVLPDGGVLYCHFQQGTPSVPKPTYSSFGSQLYIYIPDSVPVAAGKPVINNITTNSAGSYTLTGTGLNGISAGAAYGDDLQMDSNYPLVRFTDGNGNVRYGRTSNWSSTGVMTGTNLVSTQFTLPSNLPPGSYLEVVANGIASDPVAFYPSDYPTVSFLTPTNGMMLSDSSAPLIVGNADDTNATIQFVRVALNRSSDAAWYDFVSSSWVTTPFDFNRNVLNASYVFGNHTQHAGWFAQMPVLPAGSYTVQVQSVNLFNYSPWTSATFTIESPPVVTFSPLTDHQVVFNFDQLGGTVNETSTVQFKIEWVKAGGNLFWNGGNWISLTNDPGVLLPANLSGLNWTPAPGTLPPRYHLAQADYVIHVYATNAAGDGGSNNLNLTRSPLDTTPPTVNLDNTSLHPGDTITNQFLPPISGLAYDFESGVASVNVLLARSIGSGLLLYWDGSNWISTPTNLPATYTATNISWQLNAVLPSGANLPNADYSLDVSAANNEVPTGFGTLSLHFSVDYHPIYIFTYGSQGQPYANETWTDSRNWNVGSVPTSDAWVIINNYSPDNTGLGNIQLYRLDVSGSGQLTTYGMELHKLNLSGGTLTGGTITLATNGVFNWSSGTLHSSLIVPTNGLMVLAGNNGADYDLKGTLTNAGTIRLVSGNLQFVGAACDNGIGRLVNLPGGLVDFQADVSIDSACGSQPFYNDGLVRKSGGTGTSTIKPVFNNTGTVDVQTGTISLNGGGSSQGIFVADTGATLTYGNDYEVDGLLTGAGTNLLNGSTLTGTGVITNGLFVWRSGSLGANSSLTVATNSVLMLAGNNGGDYDLFGTLTNAGTIALVSGNLQLIGAACGSGIGRLVNLPGGLVDFQADVSIDRNCGNNEIFLNQGLLRKSGGTGTSTIYPTFNNSGTLDVQTGTVSLNGGGIGNGIFVAEPGATLTYSGGAYEVDSALAGGGSYRFTGGTVTLNGNLSSSNAVLAGATLAGNTVISGKLSWTSGGFANNSMVNVATNGLMVLAGNNGADYDLKGTLTNAGTIRLVSGNLQFVGAACDNGIGRLVNLPDGLVDLQADVSIDSVCGSTTLVNGGLVRKSGGTGTSTIYPTFNNSGTVDVQTGTISVNGGGSSQGIFVADAGATLTYGNDYEVDGLLTGAGTNLLNGSTLTGTGMISNGLFVWRGGTLGTASALTVATNSVLRLTGNNGADYDLKGILTNAGTIQLVSGNLQLVGAQCDNGIGRLVNLPGALVDFQADVSIDRNCGNNEIFLNQGVLRKSGGTGTSTIYPTFNNSGTLDVQTGTVSLNGGGSGNGLFVAEPGATLAYSGGAYEVDSALAGGGSYRFTGGTVTLNGNLASSNAVLAGAMLAGNTAISGKLSWTSGGFANNSTVNVTTNGVLMLAGNNGTDYNLYGILTNAGTIALVSGNLQLIGAACDGGIGRLVNLPGGLVDFQADVSIDSNCGNNEPFVNQGVLRKSGGTGISTINPVFNNSGTVDLHSGTLRINGSYLTSPTNQLLISLGGLNAGTQFGSESFNGMATFDGMLNIVLTNNFAPTNGNSFVIATYGSSTGQFSATQFPPLPLELKWKLTYAASSLLLQVVPANVFQTSSLTNGNFQFTFGGETGSSCLIEVSTNLFDWTPLLTNAPFNGTLNYVDPQTPQFPTRYYRATIFP